MNAPRLSATSGTSLHRQLFLVLKDQIARGVHAPGASLPKEEALCGQFRVSRITVRRALADLEAQGLVRRRQGLGTFVRDDLPALSAPASLSFVDALRRTAAETEVEVLGVGLEEAPADIAAALRLGANRRAVHALRLRRSGDMPLLLTDAWVPPDLGVRVTAAALRRRALYEILLKHGVRFGRVVQEITAQAADPERAALLRTEIGAPLLRMNRLLHDTHARPVQFLTVYMSPERSRIVMDVPGSAINTLSAGHVVHAARFAEARKKGRWRMVGEG